MKRDRFTIGSAFGFVTLYFIAGYLLDRFGDGSPGFGFILIPYLLIAAASLVVYLITCAFRFKRAEWRSSLSNLLAPFIGAVLAAILVVAGITPNRILFEFYRPSYLSDIWSMQSVEGKKAKEYIWIDKELWTGHYTYSVVYTDSEKPQDRIEISGSGGQTQTTYQNYWFGFYGKTITTDYNAN